MFSGARAGVSRTGLGLILGGILLVATQGEAGILDASWTAPTTNADGTPLTDLGFYRVYYSVSGAPCPGATFLQLASATPSPAPNQTVNARITGLSTTVLYNISVTAVDTSGGESACSTSASAIARLDFDVSPAGTVNFGSVNVGSFAEQVLTVSNTAGGTVSGTVSTSAPFTIVSGGTFNLVGVGASQPVTVRFTPTTSATASVNVSFTSGAGDTISRLATGTGVGLPTVVITSPTSSPTYGTPSSPLALAGTASVGVTQVTWANSRGGSGTAAGTTSWTVSGIVLQAGANVLTVTARDAANNVTTDTLTVTYDPTAPTVTITTPAAGATVSGLVSVTANATDNIGVAGVQFRLDGAPLGAETTTAPYSVTWNSAAVANGAHTLSAQVRDAAGNTSLAPNVSVTVANAQPTGLVAAYAFGEGGGATVADASGNNNAGVLSGATWTTAGKFGSALVFNGTNALVTINDAASLRLTTGMTLEAWVNPSAPTNAWQLVIYKAQDNYCLAATTPMASRPGACGLVGPIYGTAALAANTWAHLAATYDGATLRLYVNGTQVWSMAQTGTIATSANPLQIGADSLRGNFFAGMIDEVRIYNRALSQAEIQTDMNKAVASTPAEFTDDPLEPRNTVVRAVHITELRSAINSVRVARGLAAFAFTDPTLTPGTTVKAVHLTELRAALSQAYQAAGRTAPVYTDPTVAPRLMPIRAIHLNELRAAANGL